MLKRFWNWLFAGDGTVTKSEEHLLPPKNDFNITIEKFTDKDIAEIEARVRKRELWERKNLPYGS